MIKIELDMIEAIKAQKNWSKDNTSVTVDIYSPENTTTFKPVTHITVRLHFHEILNIVNQQLIFSDAGYQTKTTKSRLNCLLSHFNLPTISAKKFQWYIGDEEWTGSKTFDLSQKETEEETSLNV